MKAKVKVSGKAPTAIKGCACKSPTQDRMYGPGNRLHNFARNQNGKAGGYRCTVCENVKG